MTHDFAAARAQAKAAIAAGIVKPDEPMSTAARRARRADPDTSRAAAANANTFAANHCGRILWALRTHGAATADVIGRRAGLTVVQVDRRLTELQRTGHIALTGRIRNGMREWEAVRRSRPAVEGCPQPETPLRERGP